MLNEICLVRSHADLGEEIRQGQDDAADRTSATASKLRRCLIAVAAFQRRGVARLGPGRRISAFEKLAKSFAARTTGRVLLSEAGSMTANGKVKLSPTSLKGEHHVEL